MAAGGDPDLLRVLVSTDNHLGVWEKDEMRKDDSFRAFEEILQLAQAEDVDFLLLGGDLFHDNKPSRSTVIRTIELLHKYCLGDRPVQFQVLSDQRDNFVAGMVNFANPNLNIGLPVFTIHGNHDDPAGQDNLSAVDLLSSCGLVNYFGKVLLGGNNIGNITLAPVLLQKGGTKVALYGLGNVRDERLGRLFQTPGCVQWLRPAGSEEHALEDWLNVFVLHQNRVQHGASAKNCLQERHLPGFMDVIIWGHEHECIPDMQDLQQPDATGGSNAMVLQPGSSVATALSEGESKQKHVFVIELLRDQWRSIKKPLSTVRPFMWDSLALAQVQPPLDPEDGDAISAHLEQKVQSLVLQAARGATQQQPHGGAGAPAPLLPLVRLRVDYSGFTTVNSQRFGQKFVGKVANPHDMLLWAKAPRRVKAQPGGGGAAGGDSELAGGLGLSSLRPEALDQARIEDLVAANLQAQLDILPPEELAQALHEFVDKDERAALANCVATVLTETQAEALAGPGGAAPAPGAGGGGGGDEALDPGPTREEDIAAVVNLCVASRQASRAAASRGTAPAGAAPGGAGGGAKRGSEPGSDAWADELVANGQAGAGAGRARSASAAAMPPPAPKGRQRKGTAAGGLRQAGLAEAFSRGSQQQQQQQQAPQLALTPQGKTGSSLNGLPAGSLPASGAAGDAGASPSPGASSRRSAAGGRGARGARGGRAPRAGGRAGRGAKRTAAAAAELPSDEEPEAISTDDSGGEGSQQPARKRPRGIAAARPKRSAATSRQISYTEELLDSGDEGATGRSQRASGRRGAAGSSSSSSDAEGISDGDEASAEPEGGEDSHAGGSAAQGRPRAGGGKAGAAAAAAAAARRGGARGTQLTLGTGSVPGSAVEDGGFVSSDDEQPSAPAARPGGGRRRMPGSLA